jgi:hypothetical protein
LPHYQQLLEDKISRTYPERASSFIARVRVTKDNGKKILLVVSSIAVLLEQIAAEMEIRVEDIVSIKTKEFNTVVRPIYICVLCARERN